MWPETLHEACQRHSLSFVFFLRSSATELFYSCITYLLRKCCGSIGKGLCIQILGAEGQCTVL